MGFPAQEPSKTLPGPPQSLPRCLQDRNLTTSSCIFEAIFAIFGHLGWIFFSLRPSCANFGHNFAFLGSLAHW